MLCRFVSARLGNAPDRSDDVCELRGEIDGVKALIIAAKPPHNDHAE